MSTGQPDKDNNVRHNTISGDSQPVVQLQVNYGELYVSQATGQAEGTETRNRRHHGRLARWRYAIRRACGLVAPEPIPQRTREELERAALHDVASAYQDVVADLNDILAIQATTAADQEGGGR